jgi:hypothetical protein
MACLFPSIIFKCASLLLLLRPVQILEPCHAFSSCSNATCPRLKQHQRRCRCSASFCLRFVQALQLTALQVSPLRLHAHRALSPACKVCCSTVPASFFATPA